MKSMNTPSTGDHADLEVDYEGLDEIDAAECWRLLATQPVGRIAIVVGHYPLVFPVNFAVDGHEILYRTGVGLKLYSLRRCNVTFEVDEIDPIHRTGWSVMVKGAAHEIDAEHNHGAATRADAGGATPWAPGRRDHLIRISADEISGRRIRLPDSGPPGDPRAYL
jgi:uncharacterized protein